MSIPLVIMTTILSTLEAADELGIAKRTLLRWIYSGKIPEVKRQRIGGIEVRLWCRADLKRALRFKQQNYRQRSSEGHK
jgi:excisionase family DNA binding protein